MLLELIYSSVITSNTAYSYKSGTSMAAPMISAVVADMLWYNSSITFNQVIANLQATKNNIAVTSCSTSSVTKCYGIKVNCSALYIPKPTKAPTLAPTILTTTTTTARPNATPTTTTTTTTKAPTTTTTTKAPTTAAPTTKTPTKIPTSCRNKNVTCATYLDCCSKKCLRRTCQ